MPVLPGARRSVRAGIKERVLPRVVALDDLPTVRCNHGPAQLEVWPVLGMLDFPPVLGQAPGIGGSGLAGPGLTGLPWPRFTFGNEHERVMVMARCLVFASDCALRGVDPGYGGGSAGLESRPIFRFRLGLAKQARA
jgi:hypothetical protein